MAGRFKPKPRLNVQSDNLVYLWNMPVGFRGRDLKRKVDAQFGPVRFIETFEAWTSRPIGRVVIEFATYSAAEDFTEAMAAERVPYLQPPVQFQDLISIGKRQFFELVYRDTDVDLLACDGHPPSAEWSRERSRGGARSVLSSSSSRNNNSYQPYSREGRSRRRSPSPDLGPFPATSNSSRIRREDNYGGGGGGAGTSSDAWIYANPNFPRSYRLY